jgi:histidinol-phosphate aminotransferase
MSALDLVRADLRQFSGYLSARKQNSGGDVWLNANEAARAQPFDSQQLNRYPEPQPQALKAALCDYYAVPADQLLVTRGSDEAIDLLVRALCVPGQDSIVIQSPTFGMYAVFARLHACKTIDSPLQEIDCRFDWDIPAMIDAALQNGSKLLFLCSPANPTGQSLPSEALETLLRALHGHCLVVVDEAYGEYSRNTSAISLLGRHSNLAVLKTLSKAQALAGARIGCVIADAGLITVLKACQAPYPISKPSAEIALAAFAPANLTRTYEGISACLSERERMQVALTALPVVRRVFDSAANFLLVRFDDSAAVCRYLLERGIIVRAMTQYPAITDCLRISIGTPDENTALLAALNTFCRDSHA